MLDSRSRSTALPEVAEALRDILRKQAEAAEGGCLPAWLAYLLKEFQRERQSGSTATSWQVRLDGRLDDVASVLVIQTVLLRTAIEYGLVCPPEPSGRGTPHGHTGDALSDERERLHRAFALAAASPVGAQIFDNPFGGSHLHGIPNEAVDALARLLRSSELSTKQGNCTGDLRALDGILVELYESFPKTRHRRALIATPEFVAEFILDRTLEPAMEEFGVRDLRVMDPVCGSGRFLSCAFARLAQRLATEMPRIEPAERARLALAALHGMDLDIGAVLLTRFRVLLAAMLAGGVSTFQEAFDAGFEARVATGDSLLGSPAQGTAQWPAFAEVGSYHVVVGNPPYTSPRDPALQRRYRDRYEVGQGAFPLSVPFIERFFQLAQRGDGKPAGYVGQLTAASFMKREFGRTLVEQFFANQVHLTHVIDTSGAYLPGYGTPTVILIGRNRAAAPDESTLLVAGHRGEPAQPSDAAQGEVWRSILYSADQVGRADRWTRSGYWGRAEVGTFPWRLTSPDAAVVLHAMSHRHTLGGTAAKQIGYLATTGADDIFAAPPHSFRRLSPRDRAALVSVITGSEVRDWSLTGQLQAFLPRRTEGSQGVDEHPSEPDQITGHLRRLWPYRTSLGNRPNYNAGTYFEGRAWYDWHYVKRGTLSSANHIAFPWVATHNHFVTLPTSVVALHSAPVIRLRADVSHTDQVDLVALLNSSLVCFWLKQHSNVKGRVTAQNANTGAAGENWGAFHEFTSSRLRELPLPSSWRTTQAQILDRLGHQLAATTPQAIVARHGPSPEHLRKAKREWHDVRQHMIAAQEELDWETYLLYGLESDESLVAPPDAVPPLQLGERAFEIHMARQTAAGQLDTTWFARHSSTPVTELPEHWPTAYRNVIERRLALIAGAEPASAVEQPEFKRRWAGTTWADMEHDAVRQWLLDRCEHPNLWYRRDGDLRRPVPRTVRALAQLMETDPEVINATSLLEPNTEVVDVLANALADAHVPYLAAHRLRDSGLRKRAVWEECWQRQYEEDERRALGDSRGADEIRRSIVVPPKYASADFLRIEYWRQRGKFDVPNERFISYLQDTNVRGHDLLLGWNAWSEFERAQALVDILSHQPRLETRRVVPLLAGLRECLRQIEWQPDASAHSRDGAEKHEVRTILQHQLLHYGLTEEELADWRPPKPKRGRPRRAT
jgi:hypothetical protein